MIKLLDLLLEKKLADKDINVGDAYHRKTHVGYVVVLYTVKIIMVVVG